MDDHNNLRHSVPSLEQTWITHTWLVRVFCFFLAISEINTYLAFRHFVWKKDIMKLHNFRKKLALALIDNEYIKETVLRSKRLKRTTLAEHNLITAPRHATKFIRGKWQKTGKAPYQQYLCRGSRCKKKVRTCCQCWLGHWLCKECHGRHLVDMIVEEDV